VAFPRQDHFAAAAPPLLAALQAHAEAQAAVLAGASTPVRFLCIAAETLFETPACSEHHRASATSSTPRRRLPCWRAVASW